MSKNVIFNGNLGNSFARKRRRMPGTNRKFTPEVKCWDCMSPANSNVANGTGFEIHEFGNLAWLDGATPSNYHVSYTPLRVQFPQNGNGNFQKTGERFLFKYLKIKGFIQVMRRCAQPINWRLCLLRWDNAQNLGFNRTTYASMFKMYPSWPSTGDGQEVFNIQSYAEQAYYYKIKNPDVSNIFKRKVIASGQVPCCFNVNLKDGSGEYNYSGQTYTTLDHTYSASHQEMTGEVAMYMPLDVTVTVNDNVDNSINYYLLLEVDVPVGIESNSDAVNSASGRSDWRVMKPLTDQFTIKFFTKGYFEDY